MRKKIFYLSKKQKSIINRLDVYPYSVEFLEKFLPDESYSIATAEEYFSARGFFSAITAIERLGVL